MRMFDGICTATCQIAQSHRIPSEEIMNLFCRYRQILFASCEQKSIIQRQTIIRCIARLLPHVYSIFKSAIP